ncbi:MAG TPA: sensor histidine kinase [Pseudonocardiaceae bacterium]|nr:sensor histidine kinase [Pseudonocardiaceae bacterium]
MDKHDDMDSRCDADERFNGWVWPSWDREPFPRTRGEILGGFLWPGVFLFFLVQPITQVLDGHHARWQAVTVIADVVVFSVSYLGVLWFGQRSRHLHRALMIAWLTLFPICLAVLLGPEGLTFFTYSIAAAVMMLPANVGVTYGFGCAVSLLISSKIVDGTADWGETLVLVVLTMAMYAFGSLFRTVRQLRATQGKMARLAVAEERSRLARDLHDVLGHSLTTITVKAGLARRVLETSNDRQRAIDEVRDVEELARQALTDVRATVSGYRTASLPAELVGARAALSAAGIAADLPHAVDDVTGGLRTTFAYVLREGVTNVIRHSNASRCEVRLGDTWLEVRDNGRSAADVVVSSRATGGGHGLSGLAERVAEVDGTLDAGPLPEGGFMLRVSVPSSAKPATSSTSEPGLSGQTAVGMA